MRKSLLVSILLSSSLLFGCGQVIEMNSEERTEYNLYEEVDRYGFTNLVLELNENVDKQFIDNLGEQDIKSYLKENNDITVEVDIKILENYKGTIVFCYYEETDLILWSEMYGNIFK